MSISLYIGLVTMHTALACGGPCQGMNERNHLIVANLGGPTVGTMVNSYHTRSFIGGYTWTYGNADFALVAASGYEGTPVDVFAGLVAYPTVAYNVPINDSFRITALTTLTVNSAGFSYKF